MSELNVAIKALGVNKTAIACRVSTRAVYKWLQRGALPKTEFYGKTNYAEIIEKLTKGKYSAAQLMEESRRRHLS
nr:helix-turn-helix domain-containing protein [Pantoea stewartii]